MRATVTTVTVTTATDTEDTDTEDTDTVAALRTLTVPLATDILPNTALSAKGSVTGILHRHMGEEFFSMATRRIPMPHPLMAVTATFRRLAMVGVSASRRRTSGYGLDTESSDHVIGVIPLSNKTLGRHLKELAGLWLAFSADYHRIVVLA